MKERIANAAIREMTKRGMRFSIREVTSELGISTKTFYQYFESKEQVISFIIEQSIQDMKEAEAELMNDASLSMKQKLKKTLVLLPRSFVIHDVRILQELKQRYPEQWKLVDDYVNHAWDSFRLLLKEGEKGGHLRTFDLEVFIQVYIGGLYQLMDYEVASRVGLTLEKALEQMVDLLLIGIYRNEDGE